MSDFNYDIETTDHYYFENFTVDGKAVQDGTPTPSNPVPVEVVESPFLAVTVYKSGYSISETGTELQTSNFKILSCNVSGRSSVYLSYTQVATASINNRFHAYDSNGTWLSQVDVTQTENGTYKTAITLPSGTAELRISTRINTTINYVYVGSHEPAHVASSGCIGLVVGDTITPIDMQGNVLASLPSGIKDELTIDASGNVTITKRTVLLIYDGSEDESWAYESAAQGNFYIETVSKGTMPNSYGNNILCNYATAAASSTVTKDRVRIGAESYHYLNAALGSSLGINTAADFKTWLASNNLYVLAPLETEQTIDLGYINVSNLENIPEEIPISIVATLDPTTDYSYKNVPTYEILNPYEDYNAPEYAFPPNQMGQTWETFDANDWNESEMLDYTGQPESHAVYTVELCELMQSGAFDWKRPELDWSEAAYDEEQYARFCNYFEQRFMFREISMLPPLQWFVALKRMLVFELMPKYKPLYTQIESGIAPLGENEYYKERHISSLYPETLLSGNSDYISSGEDREWERVKVNNAAEALESYRNGFRGVDAALADELEVLFVSMYTSYVNGL